MDDNDLGSRAAIARENDGATMRIMINGFKKVIPEVAIIVRDLCFIEDQNCGVCLHPALVLKVSLPTVAPVVTLLG